MGEKGKGKIRRTIPSTILEINVPKEIELVVG